MSYGDRKFSLNTQKSIIKINIYLMFVVPVGNFCEL